MGANYFNTLDIKDKGRIVITRGKNLAVRQEENYIVNLYLLDNFYVEIYYKANDNSIDRISVMEDLKTLDLYIDYMVKK